MNCLRKEIAENINMINNIDTQRELYNRNAVQLFKNYSRFDTADKKQLARIISPKRIDFITGNVSIELPDPLKKISLV